MIIILGAFGKTGRSVAEHCKLSGSPVRRVTRNPARSGADVAVARSWNEAELCTVLRGGSALFALLPDDLGAAAFHAERRAMAQAVAGAIRRERITRVVLLSSLTAALGEKGGNGFGSALAYFERLIADSGAQLTILRASYFQENVLQALPIAERDGVYFDFLGGAARVTTIATRDVGELAARALLTPAVQTREVVDLVGPAYTASQIAAALGRTLARTLAIKHVPHEDQPALFRNFMSPEAAQAMAETMVCLSSGPVTLQGDRVEHGQTTLEEVLAAARANTSMPTEVQP